MSDGLLLVTHVPMRHGASGVLIDEQTARGIAQWCRYFDEVTYVGIEDLGSDLSSSSAWVDLAAQVSSQSLQAMVLPNAYRLAGMARHLRQAHATLRRLIREHKHLCFTIGGLVGDWPAVAAIESMAQKRNYVAWLDRVEPQIIKATTGQQSLKQRLKNAAVLPLMERYQRFILSRSETALLQGMDTFNYFEGSAPNPQCIYDTHTTKADQIADWELAQKHARLANGNPLEIVYVGRAVAMKGTSDWLDVLMQLSERGVPFNARWYGDGPDLPAMQRRVENSHLQGKVIFSGFQSDRGSILASMRNSELLLFCHKTMESPRCLIEALVSGVPLVGYHSAYAAGLVQEFGGGAFVPKNNANALADLVEHLHRNRSQLVDLVTQAAASGTVYSEDEVYRHRARLMGGRNTGQTFPTPPQPTEPEKRL